ncbi:alpha/beta hydrolase [Actinomadura atramentaria]|uniref:alpha/beta hydrolase n=1 Tax=Actinomadura atramentaria TaxID=1990 RepID=UPI001F0B645E|nr:alpha/beta hydrolase [Actinomadura atramentaria]
MRKAVVCGAALAATCVSVVVWSPQAAPAEPSPATISPAAAPGTAADTARTRRSPDRADGSVTSGSAVMVTPSLPKFGTYSFGHDRRQRIDAYWRPTAKDARPKTDAGDDRRVAVSTAPGEKPRPAVLLLHGGYWLEGDKSGWTYFARRLTDEGFAVFASDYRLAGTGADAVWPAQRDDALSALEFVKKNAGRWNVDPDRIVVVGSSAGGMLATQLGTYGEGGSLVRGVVALSPVNNPYLAYEDGGVPTADARQRKLRRAVIDLVGCTPSPEDEECWSRVTDADSATHASTGDAPMLLMHAADDFVPVAHSTGLASALRADGVSVTVKTVPHVGHGTGQLTDPQVYPRILAFLKARTR